MTFKVIGILGIFNLKTEIKDGRKWDICFANGNRTKRWMETRVKAKTIRSVWCICANFL